MYTLSTVVAKCMPSVFVFCGALSQGWSSWTMWQYTDKAKIAGISGYSTGISRHTFPPFEMAASGWFAWLRSWKLTQLLSLPFALRGVDASRFKGTQASLERLVGL